MTEESNQPSEIGETIAELTRTLDITFYRLGVALGYPEEGFSAEPEELLQEVEEQLFRLKELDK